MKNIIFIAPPSAGKGTISTKICEKYNIPHISTGDLLRDEIAVQSKIGIQVKEAMSKGELVSDDVIIKLLKKRLSSKDTKRGFILDGYPRNISQAESYDKLLEELDLGMGTVIYLDISMELAMKRALKRIVCPKCGLSYNPLDKELSPITEGICDSCGSKLIQRSDDNEESFIKRFDTYMKETYPLIDYYDKRNSLAKIVIDGKTPSEIFEEVERIIKWLL